MIVDKFHKEKLNKYGVVINTRYKSGSKQLEVSSDGNITNDIGNGIVLEKKYILNGKLNYKINRFDPRIHYMFINNKEMYKDTNCPNCGAILKHDMDNCEYCGTHYNIEYDAKDLGSKNTYDNVIHSNKYVFITLIIDFIISGMIVFTYIYSHSRTFNFYDISKALIGTIIVTGLLYYIFYILDAYIVLLPIKRYKQNQNKKQLSFWNNMINMGIDRSKFYNNFNYELNKYYYLSDNNIIDYDIIDYLDFKNKEENNQVVVITTILVREVYIENNKIKSREVKKEFRLRRNIKIGEEIKPGINIRACHGCGASIDVTKDTCEYCGSKNNYLQEWYLI
jgi:RNA polymerase subunit RPABC4/transcription elongation factor Spt4